MQSSEIEESFDKKDEALEMAEEIRKKREEFLKKWEMIVLLCNFYNKDGVNAQTIFKDFTAQLENLENKEIKFKDYNELINKIDKLYAPIEGQPEENKKKKIHKEALEMIIKSIGEDVVGDKIVKVAIEKSKTNNKNVITFTTKNVILKQNKFYQVDIDKNEWTAIDGDEIVRYPLVQTENNFVHMQSKDPIDKENIECKIYNSEHVFLKKGDKGMDFEVKQDENDENTKYFVYYILNNDNSLDLTAHHLVCDEEGAVICRVQLSDDDKVLDVFDENDKKLLSQSEFDEINGKFLKIALPLITKKIEEKAKEENKDEEKSKDNISLITEKEEKDNDEEDSKDNIKIIDFNVSQKNTQINNVNKKKFKKNIINDLQNDTDETVNNNNIKNEKIENDDIMEQHTIFTQKKHKSKQTNNKSGNINNIGNKNIKNDDSMEKINNIHINNKSKNNNKPDSNKSFGNGHKINEIKNEENKKDAEHKNTILEDLDLEGLGGYLKNDDDGDEFKKKINELTEKMEEQNKKVKESLFYQQTLCKKLLQKKDRLMNQTTLNRIKTEKLFNLIQEKNEDSMREIIDFIKQQKTMNNSLSLTELINSSKGDVHTFFDNIHVCLGADCEVFMDNGGNLDFKYKDPKLNSDVWFTIKPSLSQVDCKIILKDYRIVLEVKEGQESIKKCDNDNMITKYEYDKVHDSFLFLTRNNKEEPKIQINQNKKDIYQTDNKAVLVVTLDNGKEVFALLNKFEEEEKTISADYEFFDMATGLSICQAHVYADGVINDNIKQTLNKEYANWFIKKTIHSADDQSKKFRLFKNDLDGTTPHQEAYFKDENGNIFIGKFKDNKQNEPDTNSKFIVLYNKPGDDKKMYIGTLDKNFQPNGEGTMIYSNENVYKGQFQKGHKQGKGKLQYGFNESFNLGSVSSYEGEFLKDQKVGPGKMTYADGRIEKGTWNSKERKQGLFTSTFNQGDITIQLPYKEDQVLDGTYTMYVKLAYNKYATVKITYKNNKIDNKDSELIFDGKKICDVVIGEPVSILALKLLNKIDKFKGIDVTKRIAEQIEDFIGVEAFKKIIGEKKQKTVEKENVFKNVFEPENEPKQENQPIEVPMNKRVDDAYFEYFDLKMSPILDNMLKELKDNKKNTDRLKEFYDFIEKNKDVVKKFINDTKSIFKKHPNYEFTRKKFFEFCDKKNLDKTVTRKIFDFFDKEEVSLLYHASEKDLIFLNKNGEEYRLNRNNLSVSYFNTKTMANITCNKNNNEYEIGYRCTADDDKSNFKLTTKDSIAKIVKRCQVGKPINIYIAKQKLKIKDGGYAMEEKFEDGLIAISITDNDRLFAQINNEDGTGTYDCFDEKGNIICKITFGPGLTIQEVDGKKMNNNKEAIKELHFIITKRITDKFKKLNKKLNLNIENKVEEEKIEDQPNKENNIIIIKDDLYGKLYSYKITESCCEEISKYLEGIKTNIKPQHKVKFDYLKKALSENRIFICKSDPITHEYQLYEKPKDPNKTPQVLFEVSETDKNLFLYDDQSATYYMDNDINRVNGLLGTIKEEYKKLWEKNVLEQNNNKEKDNKEHKKDVLEDILDFFEDNKGNDNKGQGEEGEGDFKEKAKKGDINTKKEHIEEQLNTLKDKIELKDKINQKLENNNNTKPKIENIETEQNIENNEDTQPKENILQKGTVQINSNLSKQILSYLKDLPAQNKNIGKFAQDYKGQYDYILKKVEQCQVSIKISKKGFIYFYDIPDSNNYIMFWTASSRQLFFNDVENKTLFSHQEKNNTQEFDNIINSIVTFIDAEKMKQQQKGNKGKTNPNIKQKVNKPKIEDNSAKPKLYTGLQMETQQKNKLKEHIKPKIEHPNKDEQNEENNSTKPKDVLYMEQQSYKITESCCEEISKYLEGIKTNIQPQDKEKFEALQKAVLEKRISIGRADPLEDDYQVCEMSKDPNKMRESFEVNKTKEGVIISLYSKAMKYYVDNDKNRGENLFKIIQKEYENLTKTPNYKKGYKELEVDKEKDKEEHKEGNEDQAEEEQVEQEEEIQNTAQGEEEGQQSNQNENSQDNGEGNTSENKMKDKHGDIENGQQSYINNEENNYSNMDNTKHNDSSLNSSSEDESGEGLGNNGYGQSTYKKPEDGYNISAGVQNEEVGEEGHQIGEEGGGNSGIGDNKIKDKKGDITHNSVDSFKHKDGNQTTYSNSETTYSSHGASTEYNDYVDDSNNNLQKDNIKLEPYTERPEYNKIGRQNDKTKQQTLNEYIKKNVINVAKVNNKNADKKNDNTNKNKKHENTDTTHTKGNSTNGVLANNNSENADETNFDGNEQETGNQPKISWGVVIACMILLFPVGLVLLIINLVSKSKNNEETPGQEEENEQTQDNQTQQDVNKGVTPTINGKTPPNSSQPQIKNNNRILHKQKYGSYSLNDTRTKSQARE